MSPDLLTKHSTSHITRLSNHPEPINSVSVPDSVARRFWPKVDRRGDHECWLWQGYTIPRGYGMLSGERRGSNPLYAHRVSFELHHGPVPDGLEVGHRCHTPTCVNPAHLYACTHLENVRHSARDGRLHAPRPSRRKVSDAACDAMLARVRAGESQASVALDFGVSKTFVSLLVKGTRRQYRKAS